VKQISDTRKQVEAEGRPHSVKRGWRRQLHFENMPWLIRAFDYFLQISCLKATGLRNALNIQVETTELALSGLPEAFDAFNILLITDLHIDGNDHLADKVIGAVDGLNYDLCILGGDYSFAGNNESDIAFSRMVKLATFLTRKTRVVGVLGNHDRYAMAECLSQCGVDMLINDHVHLDQGADRLYLAGLDDCHYFDADDIELAEQGIPQDAFKIMLCHSPERYQLATGAGYSLYLAGHTHGGQVCLPGGFAPVTCATIPRAFTAGSWQYRDMEGYTSRGAGTSGLPVRFFCAPELALITLRAHSKINVQF
jgi:predicted MPP superfamily phosphohydrolase